jgi:hypothetical protein
MGSFTGYVVIYILGGVTFIPLIVALLFLHAYLTLKPPVNSDESLSSSAAATAAGSVSNQQSGTNNTTDSNNNGNGINNDENKSHSRRLSLLSRPNDDQFSLKSGTDVLAEKFQRVHESDVAAGYFAVCREYVPGGVNGKPPERTTPAGEVVGTESQSPSVYQSMYRSIFERKTASASIEPGNNNGGRNFRKARNVFYIVLRLVHLRCCECRGKADGLDMVI